MLILGNKYKFTPFETEKLKQKFTLTYIDPSDESNLKKEILKKIKKDKYNIIILNTDKTLSND